MTPDLLVCACGEVWWESRRQVQVTKDARRWTAPGCEDPCHQSRYVLVCIECGETVPSG